MKFKKLLIRFGTIGSVIDMMRYDCCWPASEDDSRKLEKSQAFGGERTALDHVVKFFSVGSHAPTIARWQSFGCEVLAVGEKNVNAEFDRLTVALAERKKKR